MIKHLWKKQQVTHLVIHPTRSTGRYGVDYMVGSQRRYTQNYPASSHMYRAIRNQMKANGPYRHLTMADVIVTGEAKRLMDNESTHGLTPSQQAASNKIASYEKVEDMGNALIVGLWTFSIIAFGSAVISVL